MNEEKVYKYYTFIPHVRDMPPPLALNYNFTLFASKYAKQHKNMWKAPQNIMWFWGTDPQHLVLENEGTIIEIIP